MDNLAPPEWDLLLSAAQKNDAAKIRQLIEQEGVNPSHANRVAQSALHIATLWGNVEAVEALLEHKATVNAQNSMTGATPLHCAVQSGKGPLERRQQAMELLIANGADLSICDFLGKTPFEYCEETPSLAKLLKPQRPPLFQALEDVNIDQVKELLGRDDINNLLKQESMGQTPFWYALDLFLAEKEDDDKDQEVIDRKKLLELLEILLSAGADPNCTPGGANISEMQALEGGVHPPLYRVCVALQEAYKNSDTDYAALIEAAAKLLKQHQATVTPDLHQLLLTACRKNELGFAKFLIEVIHINPNVQGRQGMTPLQFAARSGKVDMVKYLLSQPNIDITIQNDQGKTALDAAEVNSKLEIVQLLRDFADNNA